MRTGVFDIETTGLDADFAIVLCGVVKPMWAPADKVEVFSIGDLPGASPSDDRCVVTAIIDRLNEFDILVAHNGIRFDKRFLNTRALKWGLQIISPTHKFIDPVLLLRRHMKLGYNSLERAADFLGTKRRKVRVDGDTWLQAGMDRDGVALEKVVEHCIGDVLILEEVMDKLRPFVTKITDRGV